METTKGIGKGLAVLRVALGFGFLYAGLDKVVHFDGTTKAFSAAGFLKGASAGTLPGAAEGAIVNPTHDLWVALAGNAAAMSVVNNLVVFGEVAIGIALILGLATRFAGAMGALMMGLFWVANWDFAHGMVNEQFLYGIVAGFIAYAAPVQAYALDSILERTAIVKRTPALRAVIG
ncbi:MAG TPA: DoxX family membrane protein [Candidatus Limnocylindrales bacterium]|nr:DoxX family membrane protein [Candidatus Limnocylindrales bacterium]